MMSDNIDASQFMSTTEVANTLGLSRWGVIRAIHDGRLKAVKVVDRWLVRREDMREWRDARKAKKEKRNAE